MKTTPGGRENNRNWRFGPVGTLFGVAMTLALVLAALAGPGDSTALTPPPADKAEIIYSNGGRIISINADGTDRKVLTNKGKVRTPGGLDSPIGDRRPVVSPDGSKVLFTRLVNETAPDNEFLVRGQTMLLNRSTGKVREVLPKSRRVSYANLAWLPGSSRVLAARTTFGKLMKKSLVSVNLDGSGVRTIVRYRDYKGGIPPENMNFEAARIAASPDGRSLLVTSMDMWSEAGYRLGLVDLETGRRHLIAKGAHSGAWSPDGSRFVFVKDRKGELACDWDFDCTTSGDLFIANADGSGIRRLTDTRRDEANPTYSPDGSRIVFSGTVQRPLDRSTSEILSMPSGGGCAVWLTNGTPASLDPNFAAASGDYAYPGVCGQVERQALVETGLNRVERPDFGRRLWLGKSSSQGLLSMDFDYVLLANTTYGDCASFRAQECHAGASVWNYSVCLDEGNWAERIGDLIRSKQRLKRRGVWADQARAGFGAVTTLYSGRWITMISGASGPDHDKITRLGAPAQLALISELRPRGGQPLGNLPALRIPAFDFGLARSFSRQVRKSSVAQVVREYGAKRQDILDFVQFRSNLKRLGISGRTHCPSTGFPIDTNAGSD